MRASVRDAASLVLVARAGLLLLTELEVLGALDRELLLGLAVLALHAERDLLRRLRLWVATAARVMTRVAA